MLMKHRWLVFFVVLAVPACVFAQETTVSPTNRFEEVIVTATRIPTELESSPNSLTVITRDEMEQKQIRTVADILRDQVGIDVARNGQPGGLTSVFIRGANATHTLVLVDGVRVNNAFNNAFDFANLSVDNIERIEILRGPQSVLYGSEALGGVINIVTKRGAAQPTGSALLEIGENDSLRTRESFAATHEKFSISAETSYFTTDNERINSDFFAWNASARASYDALERLRVSVLGTYLQSKAGSPNDRFTNDPNDFLKNENSLVALTLDGEPTEWWTAKLTFSHAHERNFFSGLEPNPPFFFGDFTELTVSDRDQIDFQNIFSIGNAHKILVGYTFDRGHADDFNTFGTLNRTVVNHAGHAQYEFSPMQRLTLTAGGRVDNYTTFGTRGTYRFGARFTAPKTETILRASVGTGFRAPTIRDFFPPFGNPNLLPEESLGWDFGVEQPFCDGNLRVGITYFQNEFDDLIVFAFPAPVNIGRAETLGIETYAVWTPLTNLTLRGSYTWLHADDKTTGERLIRRPEHSGNVSANYKFLKKFAANANATFVGSRPDLNFSTFPATRVSNSGYVKVDLGLTCVLHKHFVVFGRVENLLDDRYEEVFGFPALGRVFWAGATARF
jgi:vitamin B12 transporter